MHQKQGLNRIVTLMAGAVLPLAADRWEGDDIEVSIIPAGFLLQTPMTPEED